MGRLDGATNVWMDGGKWVGTMTDLIWDEDGEMFRLNPRTAVWTPPDPLRRSHRRVLPPCHWQQCCKKGPYAGIWRGFAGLTSGMQLGNARAAHSRSAFRP